MEESILIQFRFKCEECLTFEICSEKLLKTFYLNKQTLMLLFWAWMCDASYCCPRSLAALRSPIFVGQEMVACNFKHPDKLLRHLPANLSIVLWLLPAWLDFDSPLATSYSVAPLPFIPPYVAHWGYLYISVHLLAIASNVFISFIHISLMCCL